MESHALPTVDISDSDLHEDHPILVIDAVTRFSFQASLFDATSRNGIDDRALCI
jgi:hypothetical protein